MSINDNHDTSNNQDNNSRLFNYSSTNDIVPKCVEQVVVHQCVTSIKDRAFYECHSLEEISIPNSVKSIGFGAFHHCSSLASIAIPNGVTSIPVWTFYQCSSLVSVIIPDSVVSIGGWAFHQCSSLVSVIIPKDVKIIREATFCACYSLVSVTLPEGLTTIEEQAFCQCRSLVSIVIPAGVTLIREAAFAKCYSLVFITIPDNLTSLGKSAFYRCSSLLSIIIPGGVISIESSTFDGCSSLITIVIPEGVTSIEKWAFNGCSSLVSIAIPNTLTIEAIAVDAFFQCNLLTQRRTYDNDYKPDTHIWLKQRFANLPIHQACYNVISQNTSINYLTTSTIQANHTTLPSTDAMGMTALHILCCNPNATIHVIKALKDAHLDAASVKNVAGMTPLMLLLKCKGISYDNLYDVDGDTLVSLVRILELGVEYDTLEMIMSASAYESNLVLSLEESRDEASNLLPFMQAALLRDCALDVVYLLAMKRPELIQKEN